MEPQGTSKAAVRLLAALLKHWIKVTIGEDAYGVIFQEFTDILKDHVSDRLDSWFADQGILNQLHEASLRADEYFINAYRDKDQEFVQWMVSLPLHDLPKLQEAIADLSNQPDESQLEVALKSEIQARWSSLTADQVAAAANTYLYGLRVALLSVEVFTLDVIGKSQLRTEKKVDELLNKLQLLREELLRQQERFLVAPRRVPLERPPLVEHFTGREVELQQLLDALQPGKVVTLCGPGGMGKTALASQAVWILAPGEQPPERFPDGILYHTFYNRPEVAILFEKIATVFGEELRPTPRDAAQRALAGQRFLLILDGTEQVDDLRSILEIHDLSCVLITTRSREDAPALRIDLDPLPPDPSVNLLKAWGGKYASDDDAVREICALVGDLPLAICLAGSYLAQSEDTAGEYLIWLKTTPLEALNQGSRRDRSVPLLLERSLGEISEPARQIIEVYFYLTYSPASPEAIAAGLDLPVQKLKPAFNELLNFGLVRRQNDSYQLSHPLIHTYACRRLTPSHEVLARLVAYYKNLSQEAGEKTKLFSILDFERSHIINVLSACQDLREWQEIIPLVWSIDEYLDLGGHYTERETTLNFGLSAARGLGDRRNEGAFLGHLGIVYSSLGQVGQAIGFFQEALSISSEIGDQRAGGIWLGNLGNTYSDLGQIKRAIDFYQQALAISRGIGDQRAEGGWLGNLGLAYSALGQVERSIEFYQQALAISRGIGDRRGEGSDMGNLGLAYYSLGQVERAIQFHQQALAISREIGDRRGEGSDLGNLGLAYYSLGQVERAIWFYQQALAIAREIGNRRAESNNLAELGNAYFALGQVDQAIEFHQQALAIAREIGDRRAEGNRLGNLGIDYSSLGEEELAIEYYGQALVIAREVSDRRAEGTGLGNLGLAYSHLGRVEQAIVFFKKALDISREIGHRHAEDAWLGNLGLAYSALGQVERAIEFHQQALTIARQIGDRRSEGNHLGNLGLAYSALGQVERSIEFHQQALVIAREIGDRRSEGNSLGNLGIAYSHLDRAELAVDFLQQALDISREIGDRRAEGSDLGNLGLIYSTLGHVDRAIEYHEEALVIARRIGDRQAEGNHLSNLGNIYLSLGQMERTIEYYKQALTIAREIGDRRKEANRNWNLGLAYQKLGNLQTAVDAMQICVDIEKELEDPRAETNAAEVAKLRAKLDQ
jgi:tetratricopeptide (TPR) repeat protein